MASLISLPSGGDSDPDAMADTSPGPSRARSEHGGRGDDHPTRRAILDLLQDGEQCAGEIARRLAVTRPNVSHHVARLCEIGLVRRRQVGAFRFFSLVGSAKPVAPPHEAAKTVAAGTPFALAFERFARERGIETVNPGPTLAGGQVRRG
jgi:DNA-binding transcriptional ArsR family regulator